MDRIKRNNMPSFGQCAEESSLRLVGQWRYKTISNHTLSRLASEIDFQTSFPIRNASYGLFYLPFSAFFCFFLLFFLTSPRQTFPYPLHTYTNNQWVWWQYLQLSHLNHTHIRACLGRLASLVYTYHTGEPEHRMGRRAVPDIVKRHVKFGSLNKIRHVAPF